MCVYQPHPYHTEAHTASWFCVENEHRDIQSGKTALAQLEGRGGAIHFKTATVVVTANSGNATSDSVL